MACSPLPRVRFDTDYVETRRVHNIVPLKIPFRSKESVGDITGDESSSTITSLPPGYLSSPEGIARGFFDDDDAFVSFASSWPIHPRFKS